MTYIKLESHQVRPVPRGVEVSTINLTATILGGLTVDFAAPFVSLGGGLAIAPLIEVDNAHGGGLRIRFDRWTPASPRTGLRWPIHLPGQAFAAQVTREFDADPNTRWDAPADEIKAWFHEWCRDNPHTLASTEGNQSAGGSDT